MITDVPGLRVGHWTDTRAATGCTVVLFPEGTVASGEVRGGAPATREVALLDPGRTVARIDALVLTGGSAFGLAAADGVVRWCEAQGRGVATPVGPVPIVVALGLFDLVEGDPSVRPGPDEGLAACRAATGGPVPLGRVGAGTGATVGKVVPHGWRPGGLVSASVAVGDLRVAALVAVNAWGIPGADDGMAAALLGGAEGPPPGEPVGFAPGAGPGWDARPAGDEGQAGGDSPAGANTTIGLVATNATLDKAGCHLVAQGAHDGLARALFPAHTRVDGDAFVAAAVGGVAAQPDAVRALAVHVVSRAVSSLA